MDVNDKNNSVWPHALDATANAPDEWPELGACSQCGALGHEQIIPQESNEPKVAQVIQDKPQEWDGEGLPPVGIVCEVSNSGNTWERCLIRHMGSSLCVVDHAEYEDQHYHLRSVTFRPLESAEQAEERERECAKDEIRGLLSYPTSDDEKVVNVILEWHLGRLTAKGDV